VIYTSKGFPFWQVVSHGGGRVFVLVKQAVFQQLYIRENYLMTLLRSSFPKIRKTCPLFGRLQSLGSLGRPSVVLTKP